MYVALGVQNVRPTTSLDTRILSNGRILFNGYSKKTGAIAIKMKIVDIIFPLVPVPVTKPLQT